MKKLMDHLEHPLGKAVVQSYKKGFAASLPEATDFRMFPGRGVSAVVDGRTVLAGNAGLLEENGVSGGIPDAGSYTAQGCTVIYLALDGRTAGYIVLADTLRQESAEMIARLRELGIQPVLLTGDNQNAAGSIGKKLGITDIRAQCLPEDKLNFIGMFQSRQQPVCMTGDGINDAPALKKADVGIAMGGVGSDIAVDAADIALVDDEMRELPHLIALSKHMMTTIKLNMTFSMTLNFAAIILAMTGKLDPVIGALVHNAGSVLVITNSAFLLKWRKKQ